MPVEATALIGEKTPKTPKKHFFVDLTATRIPVPGAISVIAAWYILTVIYFHYVEGWEWWDTMYFASYTLTTVGYGDVHPVTTAGKIGTIVSLFTGMTIVTSCIGMLMVNMQRRDTDRMHHAESAPAYRKLYVHSALLFGVVIFGAIFVGIEERLTVLDSLYWAMVSVTAVGYGEIATSHTTHIFCVFYLPIGVVAFGFSAASLVNVLLQIETNRRVRNFVAQGVTKELIQHLDHDKTGSVDKYEFCTYVLVGQGKLTWEDVHSVNKLFETLDRDKSGHLDMRDTPA